MKPQTLHAHEDRLLDFAYGELPAAEAQAMEVHLQGCARCTQALDGIRGVRATMSQLSAEPAPDAGLDSLLAYAQQAARRAAAGPEPTPSWWRRWLMPAVGLAAVSFIGIISHQVAKTVDLQPSFSELAKHDASQERVSKKDYAPSRADYGQRKGADEALEVPPPAEAAAPVAAPPPAPAVQQQVPRPEAKEMAKLADLPAPDRAVRALKKEAASAGAPSSNWSNVGASLETRADSKSRDKEGAASQGYRAEAPSSAPVQRESAPAPAQPPAKVAMRLEDEASAEPAAEADVAAESLEERVAESQAPKYAPPRSSLRLGGSPAPLGSASAPTAGAVAVQAEDIAPQPSAPGGAGVASAAPAPRKPNSAKSADADDGFDSLFGAKKAKAAASSSAQYSQRASEAASSGERTLEANFLRLALKAGATGRERLNLLLRLCDAELALGRREAALEACGQVLSEDPDSSAAQEARRRLDRESGEASRAKKAAPAPAAPASTPVKR